MEEEQDNNQSETTTSETTKLRGTVLVEHGIVFEKDGLVLQARHYYQQGLNALLSMLTPAEHQFGNAGFFERVEQYGLRITQINNHIKDMVKGAKPVEVTRIPAQTYGYNYEIIFGQYLTDDTRELLIEEPVMEDICHFKNLRSFLELLVAKCRCLEFVELCTPRNKDKKGADLQETALCQLKNDMGTVKRYFGFRFDNNIKEMRLIFDNGCVVRTESNGLHQFERAQDKLELDGQLFSETKGDIIHIYRSPRTFRHVLERLL
ncbi:uncharacterized protein LOC115627352 [Scaptodrosophila lebanonensis]|uniref:Uncharacterized protein LOC115627352 n=1 Tax=Drosophila lebanonensis TaxID=7225 RepID=A0A6J2TTF8_DROLE|nr:uncharacterized protein LOC115627352 [Scaptodrosophila lebanonensis]